MMIFFKLRLLVLQVVLNVAIIYVFFYLKFIIIKLIWYYFFKIILAVLHYVI